MTYTVSSGTLNPTQLNSAFLFVRETYCQAIIVAINKVSFGKWTLIWCGVCGTSICDFVVLNSFDSWCISDRCRCLRMHVALFRGLLIVILSTQLHSCDAGVFGSVRYCNSCYAWKNSALLHPWTLECYTNVVLLLLLLLLLSPKWPLELRPYGGIEMWVLLLLCVEWGIKPCTLAPFCPLW